MAGTHQFDEILVTKRGDAPRPMRQAPLSFDKKGVYAGVSGNFYLKFKEVAVVESTWFERDVYDDRRYSRGGRGGRSSETLALKLQGKKMTFECTVRKGGSAKEARALKAFEHGLKEAHRKVWMKGGGTDPYAPEKTKRGSAGPTRTGIQAGGKKSRVMVTPAHGLLMSPNKKRSASAGSFTSPGRRRGSRDNDGEKEEQADQYAHYDPASHSATPKSKSAFANNNVVLDRESPAAKRLILPPKSPRNATPTKVRFVEARGSPASGSITNRLNGMGEFRRKQVKFDPLDEDDSRRETTFQERQTEKDRRQKAGGAKEDGGEDSDESATPPPSARKKLKLSLDGDSDDEHGMEEERKVPPSPSPSSVADVPEEESPGPTKPSVADAALAPSPKKASAKKGTIARFFTASAKKGAATEAKRPSSPGTYGGALSTPSKKARAEGTGGEEDAPATPPRHTTPRPTPVQRQSQRKSRYFGDEGRSERSAAANRLKYSSEEEDVVPGYQVDSGYYSGGENEPVEERKMTTYQRNLLQNRQRGRTGYGRNIARMPGRLGQSRLAARQMNEGRDVLQSANRRKKVDFSEFEARDQRRSLFAPQIDRNGTAEPSTPSAPRIPGIQNLGNTCYLSASLQALFSVPDFIAGLYKTYAERATQSPAKQMPLTKALLEVAAAIGVLKEEDCPLIDAEEGKTKLLANKVGNPARLKKQMDALTDKFAGYEQRDAHEFLSDLVDFLHDELAASPEATGSSAKKTNAKGEGNADQNKEDGEEKEAAENDAASQHRRSGLPTDDFFHLNVLVCLECDSCGYSRSKNELYRHLSVDVGKDSEVDKWTVERSLRQFFQPERRELKCEKCEAGKTATQTMEITSCPKALLLHFKRFIVTQEAKGGANGDKENNKVSTPPVMEMVLRKNKARISLEESLSINPFVGSDDESHSGKYHLRGVVHHVGGAATSGHYTACAKRSLADPQVDGGRKSPGAPEDNEEHWVFFDDRVGTKKDQNYVIGLERNQRNGYMALYELK